jgi:hypothetical protein
MIGAQHQDIVCLLEETWCRDKVRNNLLYPGQLLKLNIEPWHKGFVKSYG